MLLNRLDDEEKNKTFVNIYFRFFENIILNVTKHQINFVIILVIQLRSQFN